MRAVRTLHLVVALVIPALLGTLTGLLVALLTRDRRRTINSVASVVGHLGPVLAGTPLQITGRDHSTFAQPAIITFNHQSGLDPVIMCAVVQRNVVGVAKDSLRHNPLLGPLLRVTGTIFLGGKEERRSRVLTQAEAVIHTGCSIVIAPEGTRVAGRQVGRFHSGACELARRCDVPVIPVVIHNSGERLAPRSHVLHSGPVRVTVLTPYRIPPDQSIEAATQTLEQLYVATLAQH